MADPDDNAFLAFLNLPAGNYRLCRDVFNDDGSGKSILSGQSSLLPNIMSQQLLSPDKKNDVAKMAQMAIFPLNYGDLDDGQLLDYQDASKITQVNAKQYSAVPVAAGGSGPRGSVTIRAVGRGSFRPPAC